MKEHPFDTRLRIYSTYFDESTRDNLNQLARLKHQTVCDQWSGVTLQPFIGSQIQVKRVIEAEKRLSDEQIRWLRPRRGRESPAKVTKELRATVEGRSSLLYEIWHDSVGPIGIIGSEKLDFCTGEANGMVHIFKQEEAGWGKIATAMHLAVLQRAGFDQAHFIVVLPNFASVALHQKFAHRVELFDEIDNAVRFTVDLARFDAAHWGDFVL